MSSKQYFKPGFESLGLTVEKLPVGSPERAIAETIQQVMKLDNCTLDTALDRVRNNLMQANIPLDCAVWGQAKAAAEATVKSARKSPSKAPKKKSIH